MQPEAYNHLTQQLATALEADARVIGFIALGSMAATTRLPDAWSDHDFFVITVPGAQEELRQDLSWLPQAEDRIVLQVRETAHGLKVVYASGHLLEFAVFDLTELAQAGVNDYRVLLDRGGITDLLPRLVNTAPLVPPAYDAGRDVAMVLALILVGAGREARGEHISAHAFIKLYVLYHLLPLLRAVLTPEDAAAFAKLDNLDAFRRFEQAFPTVGAAISQALLLPPLQAGGAILDLLETDVRPRLPDFPDAALATVRGYLAAVAG